MRQDQPRPLEFIEEISSFSGQELQAELLVRLYEGYFQGDAGQFGRPWIGRSRKRPQSNYIPVGDMRLLQKTEYLL